MRKGEVFRDAIFEFYNGLMGFYCTYKPILNLLQENHNTNFEKIVNPIRKKIENKELSVKFENLYESIHNINVFGYSSSKILEIYLVASVTCFDVFLSNLIRTVYYDINKSIIELLDEKKRDKDTEEDLLDTLSDKNRWDILKSIDKKMIMKIDCVSDHRKDFSKACRIRNIIVHNDGKIDQKFIDIINKYQIAEEECYVGMKYILTEEKFKSLILSIFQFGFELGYSIWMKYSTENDQQYQYLSKELSNQLFHIKEYALLIKIIKFVLDVDRNINIDQKKDIMLKIAQCYKWNGNAELCNTTLDSFDWSGSDESIYLAIDVLKDNFDEAYEHMKKIGKNHQTITAHTYRNLTLFNKIRNEDKFSSVFYEIFGEPL